MKTVVAVGDDQVALMVLRSDRSEDAEQQSDSEVLSLKQAARAASRLAERELILKPPLARTCFIRLTLPPPVPRKTISMSGILARRL